MLNVVAENPLTLQLTDSYAQTVVAAITLRGPGSPPAPQLEASAGPQVVLVSCAPSTEPALAGQHIKSPVDLGWP